MRLLVTRPEADAARTADALRARGLEVVVAPLLRIEPVNAEFGGPFDAVLMTSANAARAIAAHPRAPELFSLPCLTVGDRSAEAARAAGFTRVESADGALPDLVRLVTQRHTNGRLLYLAGEDRAGEFSSHGVAVETAVVYRAVAVEQLPPDVARAQLDGVLHYSRRSAATLLRLAEKAGALNAVLGLAHYCLSAEVAAPLRAAGAQRIAVAASPTESALLTLLK
jgi:uroporphyrinogen-III synthase